MCVSAVMFIDSKGKVIISRFYRDNVSRNAAHAFRTNIIANKQFDKPVVNIDKCSFMYVRVGDIFVTAVTRQNANPSLVFQFLYDLIGVFKDYFGGKFDEESLQSNFVLIYELLDETMDHGYPQLTSTDSLSLVIKMANAPKKGKKESPQDAGGITSQITGAVDWRQPGKYKYKKNVVFIDVLESVNLLMSHGGVTLRSDVSGKIMMKTFLTGMPECEFGMNDKLSMDKALVRGKAGGKKQAVRKENTAPGGIAIDDVTFHRCVNLSNFDRNRTIQFIPPDGSFELMRYRVTHNVSSEQGAGRPFRVLPVVIEHGRGSRVEYQIKVNGDFDERAIAKDVVIRIPTPPNLAKIKIEEAFGKAKYDPGKHQVVWKIKKFAGDASYTFRAKVNTVPSITEKVWSRPPITMDFTVEMFASSGLHILQLKVVERSGYEPEKWVRYLTKAGQYQIRI